MSLTLDSLSLIMWLGDWKTIFPSLHSFFPYFSWISFLTLIHHPCSKYFYTLYHPQFSFPEGHNSSSGLYDQNFCSKTFCIYLHPEPASTIKHTRVLCLRQKITDMLLGDCLALICAQRPGRLNNRGLGLCMLSKVHCLSHTGTFV